MLAQNLIVFLIVSACVATVALQVVRTLKGRKSKLGSCCAKGCDAGKSNPTPAPATARRIHFMPAETLASSARRSRR